MMQDRAWLTIIGIGSDGRAGLGEAAREALDMAETVYGGTRHLTLAGVNGTRGRPWPQPFSQGLSEVLARRGTPTAVLATGDPMHFGIGATLARHLRADELRVLPSVSAFSLAAARLGWPLQDAGLISLHGRPVERLVRHLVPGARLLVLTGSGAQLPEIGELMTKHGFGASSVTVLADMGDADEQRHNVPARDLTATNADLVTLAIACVAGPDYVHLPVVPGLPDDAFLHDGQLTKREVRAATVAALSPLRRGVLWDVGAGSGSVAIEWMRCHPDLSAICFERDAERLAMIARNRKALGVPELEIVAGSVPETLSGQPRPDAVFLGGAVADETVFQASWSALTPGGTFVANAVTLEGEAALIARQSGHGGDLVRMDISHLTEVGPYRALRPRMAVLQWRARKSDEAKV
ncbi:MAG: precorrin-6y C5,15-methyltransferase (decarboxylating) subunit CbiE [Pseudomonadota bacterium]